MTHVGIDQPLFGEEEAKVEAAIERGDFEEAGRLEVRLWVDGPRREEGAAPARLREKVLAWTIPINQVSDWGDSLQLDTLAFRRLDEVTAPTLVIVSEEDATDIHAGCRAAAERIPNAQYVELAGTAHLPNPEVAETFNAALERYLD